MQMKLLNVKQLKQQNYERIQTYKGRTKYPNSCTIRIRKQDEIAKNQKRREKSNDAKVQTIKKVGDTLPYFTQFTEIAYNKPKISGKAIIKNKITAISHKITFTTNGSFTMVLTV